MTNLTFDQVACALETSEYRYARTMQWCPHWYTLREKWKQPVDFEAVVQYIRDHGYDEQFNRKWFVRMNVNDMKYWSMGSPLHETILINRAYLDTEHDFCDLAFRWDQMHSEREHVKARNEVVEAIGYREGAILDVGCGTGWLLDFIEPDYYRGIDPSLKMLARFRAKHPSAMTTATELKSFWSEDRFDHVVATFGSASHLTEAELLRVPKLGMAGGRFFLSFYPEDIEPMRGVEHTLIYDIGLQGEIRTIGGYPTLIGTFR